MRRLIFVAHPIRPTQDEINAVRFSDDMPGGAAHGLRAADVYESAVARIAVESNVRRAMRWLVWLRRKFPGDTFIAPYVASILSGEDDADPAQREAGIVDTCATIERCDGIALVGGRLSLGMEREVIHGVGHRIGFAVFDFRAFGSAPPDEIVSAGPVDLWAVPIGAWTR